MGSMTPLPSAAAMLFTQIVLIGWVEGKRWADLKNPGSQGDGSFLGVTDELKGQSNGYDSYIPPLICHSSSCCDNST